MGKNPIIIENIKLSKFVHGGQCIAEGPVGKKLFVWGGLPDEKVNIRVTKKKSSYLEGVVEEVIEPSADRIEPKEPKSYLSTSPWQIMTFNAENRHKQEILNETFEREGLKSIKWSDFSYDDRQYGYRNKMEIGFWGDVDGLHLAHFVRGTHGKQIVDGSILAPECINSGVQAIRSELNRLGVWAGKLKTVLIRASQAGEAVAALFMKEELDLGDFKLPKGLKGLDIYYSNPQSPASVPTKKLYSLGDINLTDSISTVNITYDVMSFFQVNVPVFELALEQIKSHIGNAKSVDMYSGVGTIGLVMGSHKLIESDSVNIVHARSNSPKTTEVVHANSETALDNITGEDIVIVDPPRAGLHKDLIDRLQDKKPPKIVYLSCNPSTQARDVKMLSESYKVTTAQGFNFFPRTPHIESLIILEQI